MAYMPTYHVSKGPFRYLDDVFKEPGSPAFGDALKALGEDEDGEASERLREAAEARSGKHPEQLSADDVGHLEADWLHAWWQQHAPADTLRDGLREAIQHAANVNKPMEFLWVCIADDTFQVYFSESYAQVTVIILTPPPIDHTYDLLSTPENIWVVKLEDELDAKYPDEGHPGVINPPQKVGEVTTEEARLSPDPRPVKRPSAEPRIIKQRVYHSKRADAAS
jgi:hypothetical protein